MSFYRSQENERRIEEGEIMEWSEGSEEEERREGERRIVEQDKENRGGKKRGGRHLKDRNKM